MAEYQLADIRQAAQKLQIEYRGLRVQRDVANLGYELQDVADCICNLTERDFRKSHFYEDGRPPDDDYICQYKKTVDGEEHVETLYVKFCFINDHLLIDLGSFHLPRY
ncbi:type II toxin-antitoxin system MqsR family toxin [Aeromonas hydrophila]|uniref:type II toxin-antitoxin system MqsR family toxin n=1 Tax=Aeromonas hydrophila TaxID=644 RepID=UPI0013790064|nr:type II toxin-antitoxin system MqsR family toxin [Aeromonas hydrophila]